MPAADPRDLERNDSPARYLAPGESYAHDRRVTAHLETWRHASTCGYVAGSSPIRRSVRSR